MAANSAGPMNLYAWREMHRVAKRIAAIGVRRWQHGPDFPVALGRANVFVALSAFTCSIGGLIKNALTHSRVPSHSCDPTIEHNGMQTRAIFWSLI